MRRVVTVTMAALMSMLVSFAAQAKFSPTHRIAPAPGVSLVVPDGFAACDPVTNRALGNAPHLVVLESLCSKLGNRPGMVVMLNIDPAVPVFVFTLHIREYDLPQQLIAQATPKIDATAEAVVNSVAFQ